MLLIAPTREKKSQKTSSDPLTLIFTNQLFFCWISHIIVAIEYPVALKKKRKNPEATNLKLTNLEDNELVTQRSVPSSATLRTVKIAIADKNTATIPTKERVSVLCLGQSSYLYQD